jgi:hypothetical protein
MAKNVYRFRKLKWGNPEKPWLKRGSPLPPVGGSPTAPAPRQQRSFGDSPWVILGGAALAFGLGWLIFAGS